MNPSRCDVLSSRSDQASDDRPSSDLPLSQMQTTSSLLMFDRSEEQPPHHDSKAIRSRFLSRARTPHRPAPLLVLDMKRRTGFSRRGSTSTSVHRSYGRVPSFHTSPINLVWLNQALHMSLQSSVPFLFLLRRESVIHRRQVPLLGRLRLVQGVGARVVPSPKPSRSRRARVHLL